VTSATRPRQGPGSGRMLRAQCERCGCLLRITRGSVLRARGLPTCACGGDFYGEDELEQMFRQSSNGRGHTHMTERPSLEALLVVEHASSAARRFPASWTRALDLQHPAEQRAAIQALLWVHAEMGVRKDGEGK